MQPKDRIICALDVDDVCRAIQLVEQLKGHVGVFKVGLELATAAGVQVFARLREAGAERFFYDAKLHDIPNTVAGAMRGVVRLGVWCVTVHATGGSAMLRAAVETARQTAEVEGLPRPRVLAVTVLTSIGPETLRGELRVETPLADYVGHLARLAYETGCDGVIASPQEIEAVRAAVPAPGFLIVTPGVRPAGSQAGDQARVMTPAEAIQRGADYLVIGRPIIAAPDPVAAAQQMFA
ncbi:MAG TPA: orotidine-5'-phosphate decarboxylase [Chthonomonadaceae bacterium]|nr:orotidine-5'-phosphate decarboxylase [Chthonomonadaceae bacterium]